MARYLIRHEVPVEDDQPSVFRLNSSTLAPVRAVAARRVSVVEFWVERWDGSPLVDRLFQVFGTGQALPDRAAWRGTCPRTAEGLVWHLYELV